MLKNIYVKTSSPKVLLGMLMGRYHCFELTTRLHPSSDVSIQERIRHCQLSTLFPNTVDLVVDFLPSPEGSEEKRYLDEQLARLRSAFYSAKDVGFCETDLEAVAKAS